MWGLVGFLLLSACSSTTFVYNRLDFLLPWYLGDYVELNSQQEAYLDELLVPFLLWHRRQELPVYLMTLDVAEDSLNRPTTPEIVATIFAEFETAWLRLEGEALGWLLDLGAQLSDEQLAGLLEELWEQQGEFEEEYLTRSDEEVNEDNYENLVDSAEDYLGSLSEQQRDLVREYCNRMIRSDKVWLQERTEWLTQLGILLQRQPQWQQRVRETLEARRNSSPPEYVRIYEHNIGVIFDVVAQLVNGRSERQDRHLRNKLSELRTDLETLIAQGRRLPATPPG